MFLTFENPPLVGDKVKLAFHGFSENSPSFTIDEIINESDGETVLYFNDRHPHLKNYTRLRSNWFFTGDDDVFLVERPTLSVEIPKDERFRGLFV